MTTKQILFGLALILAIASFILAFVGLPDPYDTEPILAVGLFLVALTGLLKDES